ncbi:hypothetical protein J7J48_01500 [Halomonas sp. ISL-106]|nr:hypothetical protein [Halomonas sp. ISL-106]MBT2796738.1 hypothetical protein [Halomonas sp. ISL-104]OAL59970.1 hypothetical protein A6R74_01480 [Halomonas sp. ALS9]
MEERLLVNVLVRLSGRALAGLGLSFAVLCSSDIALAANTLKDPQLFEAPRPFEAQYRLEVRGWPGATITHRLSNEGNHWLSDMRFSVTVARGQEFSRFSLNDNDTHALLYSSSYSLLGVGDSYQLSERDIPTLDRQTALFDLSRRAGHENCTESAPCDIEFVDHKGRDEHFQYYVDKQRITDPGSIGMSGDEFEALNVSLIDVEKPDRLLQIRFHPDWPGLILSVVYQKEGSRETQLTLTNFQPNGGATP